MDAGDRPAADVLATELSDLLKVPKAQDLDYKTLLDPRTIENTTQNIKKLTDCVNHLDDTGGQWPDEAEWKQVDINNPANINTLIKVLQSNSEVINTPGPSMFRKAANLLGFTKPKPEKPFDPRKGFWNQESLQRHTASSVSGGGTQGFR